MRELLGRINDRAHRVINKDFMTTRSTSNQLNDNEPPVPFPVIDELTDVVSAPEDALRNDRIKRQINDGHSPAGSEEL